jgi:hypothetical protein
VEEDQRRREERRGWRKKAKMEGTGGGAETRGLARRAACGAICLLAARVSSGLLYWAVKKNYG